MHPDHWSHRLFLLDGATGTVLQQRGLPAGGQPELLNLTDGPLIQSVHRDYLDAGSQILYANTFGANRLKLARTGHSVQEVIGAGVALVKAAAGGQALVALDIGPLGELLEPMGSLTFEQAYDLFAEMARAGASAGLDYPAAGSLRGQGRPAGGKGKHRSARLCHHDL